MKTQADVADSGRDDDQRCRLVKRLVDHSSTALSMENRQTSRAVWIHAIFLKMCAKGGFEVH
jgi:hypothetical protein